jgi:hypothetical protein
MNMRNKDLIAPIRTRGAIRVRGSEAEENVISTHVRTRGVIRTRGTVRAAAPILKIQRRLTVDVLVRELREEVGDLPFTTLIHGCESQPSEEFLAQLSPLLRKEDALWLIPTGAKSIPTELFEVERAVVLDLSRDTDQRIYRNLIGDIVFLPALDAAEATQVAEWRQRARAVIINGQGNAVLQASCEAMLITHRWSGGADLEEYAIS